MKQFLSGHQIVLLLQKCPLISEHIPSFPHTENQEVLFKRISTFFKAPSVFWGFTSSCKHLKDVSEKFTAPTKGI